MGNTKSKFMDILVQSEANDLFDETESSLSAVVHTGRRIETFSLKVEFYNDIVIISTFSYLGSDEDNAESINVFLESLNSVIEIGKFMISEDNRIMYQCGIPIDVIANIDNPFEIIFLGCELFGCYQDSILKALLDYHMVTFQMS